MFKVKYFKNIKTTFELPLRAIQDHQQRAETEMEYIVASNQVSACHAPSSRYCHLITTV